MKNTQAEKDLPACLCIFCSAHHYTLSLFEEALSTSNGDANQLYHTLFHPIARTTILNKFQGLPLYLLTDQICLASEELWMYWRSHSLLATQDNLNILSAIAFRAGVHLYRKFKNIESHKINPQRIYNDKDTEIDPLDLISIIKNQDEDSLISQINARNQIVHLLSHVSTDAQIKAVIGGVLLNSGFFDTKFDTKNEQISKTVLLNAVKKGLKPYDIPVGIKTMFYSKCYKLANDTFSVSTLKNAAYNRAHVLKKTKNRITLK